MAKYEDAPNQSEYPAQACKRAAWLLNSWALDVTKFRRKTMKEFNAAYKALQSLNIPVECTEKGAGPKKAIRCFCYRPLSGLAGRGRKGKRRGR